MDMPLILDGADSTLDGVGELSCHIVLTHHPPQRLGLEFIPLTELLNASTFTRRPDPSATVALMNCSSCTTYWAMRCSLFPTGVILAMPQHPQLPPPRLRGSPSRSRGPQNRSSGHPLNAKNILYCCKIKII